MSLTEKVWDKSKLSAGIRGGIYGVLLAVTLMGVFNRYINRPGSERIPKNKVGLIIVDMQDRFLKKIDSNELKKELPNYLELIGYARENKIPIYVLEIPGYGATTEKLREALGDTCYYLLPKITGDGFSNLYLNKVLKKKGVEKIVLSGVNASFCVRATANGALKNGYEIITCPEIISDSNIGVLAGFRGILENPGDRFLKDESLDFYKKKGVVCDSFPELIGYLNANKD